MACLLAITEHDAAGAQLGDALAIDGDRPQLAVGLDGEQALGFAGVLEDAGEAPLELVAGAGAAALLGDILADADQERESVVLTAAVGVVPLDLALLAARGDNGVAVAADRLAAGGDPGQAFAGPLALVGGHEGLHPALADELRERTADHLLEEGVGVVDLAREIEDEDDQRRGVDDRGRERAIEPAPVGRRVPILRHRHSRPAMLSNEYIR